MQDAIDRDRLNTQFGEASSQAKLTGSDVHEIRRLLEEGRHVSFKHRIRQRELAARFGVTTATISNINKGVVWKHI